MDQPPGDWIGIEAPTLEGEIKAHLWYQNLEQCDLAEDGCRYQLSWLITAIKLDLGVDVVVGPAIELSSSDLSNGIVGIDSSPDRVALYVDAQQRVGFGILASSGIRNEADLIQADSTAFIELYRKALASLPHSFSTQPESEKP